MSFFRLDPDLYAGHRDEVLWLSNSFQRIASGVSPTARSPGARGSASAR